MVRLARVVIPGLPHHITQRGNRRQTTFFCEEDYAAYSQLMGQWCKEYGVEIWAYCLMPNHVHLIATPKTEDGLRRAIGEAHRRYTRRVNFRELLGEMARTPLARAVHLFRHGRALFAGGGSLRGTQPGSRRLGRRAKRLSVEQRSSTLEAKRRLLGQSFSTVEDRA